MEIVMLAAGTSSRMGKVNKLLLPYKDSQLACYSCLQALSFLETLNEPSHLIIVTGFRRQSLEKSLKQCKTFIETTTSPISMTIVHNRNFRKGQFTSAKTGVKEVKDNSPFFICLADMPKLTSESYKALLPLLKDNDAVKPFCNEVPGHPVLISSKLKEKILKAPDTSSVKEVLSKSKLYRFNTDDDSFITDCDTPQAFEALSN